MEALSNSAFHHTPLSFSGIIHYTKVNSTISLKTLSYRWGSRVTALGREEEDSSSVLDNNDNGPSLVSEQTRLSLLHQHQHHQSMNEWIFQNALFGFVSLSRVEQSSEKEANLTTPPPLAVSYGSSTSSGVEVQELGSLGLPISGGVRSATSAHGLPRPALAVRNLMEQIQYFHSHRWPYTPGTC